MTPALPIDESLAAPTIRSDVVFRIGWADGQVSRLTSARLGLRLPSDAIEDEDAAVYASFPALLQIPALAQIIGGVADIVEFSLGGLPSDIATLADEESHLVRGASIHVGKVRWDTRWRMVGGARWIWLGNGGVVKFKRSGGAVSGGIVTPPTYTISIEAATEQIRRAGSALSYWTDAQQQRRSPGDRGLDRVAYLSQGLQKAWPNF